MAVVWKRRWIPGKDGCRRGRCAKKMFLAMEQLAAMADADWPAQEDPNCSTTAAFIITAPEAVQTRRHGKGLDAASEDTGLSALRLGFQVADKMTDVGTKEASMRTEGQKSDAFRDVRCTGAYSASEFALTLT